MARGLATTGNASCDGLPTMIPLSTDDDWIVQNPGAGHRVVVTKELPGTRWLSALDHGDCEVHISRSQRVLEESEIVRAMGDRCDGIIGQLTETWSESLFAALERVGGRVYANYAVGYNNVDVSAATRHGIAVGNTPGVLTETTAEMAVALLFAAARRVVEADAYVRAGKFEGWLPGLFLGQRLWGGTLGIIGAGRIGTSFARMVAPGHDMDVLYHDLHPARDLEAGFEALNRFRTGAGQRELRCRRASDPDEVFREADVVSLHVLLDDTTYHLVDARRLGLMKPAAILVNTSRGPVLDETALVKHLQTHPEFRVGLDVFEDEPRLAPGLTGCRNAVIVPHIASATSWTRSGMATLAACNVAAVLRGDPVTRSLRVQDFLEGETFPARAPAIVNASDLGLDLA